MPSPSNAIKAPASAGPISRAAFIRCAPRRAKRRRVVRGRRGLAGEAASPSRRKAIVGEPVYGSPAGRPRAVQAEPDTARLRRDRGREGDLEVPSRILRAGARFWVIATLVAL